MTVGLAFDQVLAAAQSGAGWARTRLYEDLAPAVAGYIRSQGVPDVADTTSDVFVAVLSGLGSFHGDERRFRSWVFTIAYRRVADEWRARAGRAHATPLDPVELAAHSATTAPAAEDQAMAKVGEERLRRLLAELTEDQRQVLALRVIADLSIDDVAEIMRRPAGAVKALQHRALAALRRKIADEAVSR